MANPRRRSPRCWTRPRSTCCSSPSSSTCATSPATPAATGSRSSATSCGCSRPTSATGEQVAEEVDPAFERHEVAARPGQGARSQCCPAERSGSDSKPGTCRCGLSTACASSCPSGSSWWPRMGCRSGSARSRTPTRSRACGPPPRSPTQRSRRSLERRPGGPDRARGRARARDRDAPGGSAAAEL